MPLHLDRLEATFGDLTRTRTRYADSLRVVGRVSVTDEDRLIEVGLDEDGLIESVVLREGHRPEAQGERAGAALSVAISAVIAAGYAERGRLLMSALAEREPAQESASDPSASPASAISSSSGSSSGRVVAASPHRLRTPPLRGREGDRALRGMFDEVGGLRGAVAEVQESMNAAMTQTFLGQAGGVEARCNAEGFLVSLSIDDAWFASHSRAQTADRVSSAIRTAQAGASAAGKDLLDRAVAGTRLGRLMRMLTGEPPSATGDRPPAPPEHDDQEGDRT